MLEKGLVQIYTGNGKGKSTAAFGLALRAAGHRAKVLIYQFLKPPSLELGERVVLRQHLENIKVHILDAPWDMFESLNDEKAMVKVRAAIDDAMRELETAAHEQYYDMIILDEIIFCYRHKLVSLEALSKIIQNRDKRVEIVMTGRGATEELIELADLVTEMKEIKHPHKSGVPARKGIEY